MEYELELDKAAERINKEGAKLVCLQLPDGLKKRAEEIEDALEKKTRARFVIWMGSCYGACDIPAYIEKLGVDMIIQWGHSGWKY